jgi:acyl carrier protein
LSIWWGRHASGCRVHLELFTDFAHNQSESQFLGDTNMEQQPVPGTEAARREFLQHLWSTQLNRPNVGIQDDFFDAGGSSMQVIEMLMTVADKFGKEIDYVQFLQEPCIRKLDELLDS